MTPDDSFLLLALRYLDGVLTAAELRQFNARLLADAEAREWLNTLAAQSLAVATKASAQHRQPVVMQRPGATSSMWLALAASIAVMGVVGFFLRRSADGPRPVAVVSACSGAVLHGQSGSFSRAVAVGESLASGTLRTESEGASAELRFADGTTLQLAGSSEVTFSDAGQKLIEVAHGNITAAVAKQPAGRPMLVRTAMAEVEVLGTVFSLNAESASTSVSVEEGRVKMKRLLDGRSVVVSAGATAQASWEEGAKLVPAPGIVAPLRWEQSFEKSLSGWSGEWLPAGGGVLRAEPRLAGRGADGEPLVFHVVQSPHAWGRGRHGLVLLQHGATLALEFREAAPNRPIEVMLSTNLGGRRWAGNYFYQIPPDQGERLADGWRRVLVPLNQPEHVSPGALPTLDRPGLTVFFIHITSLSHDTGLEVRRIGITGDGKF